MIEGRPKREREYMKKLPLPAPDPDPSLKGIYPTYNCYDTCDISMKGTAMILDIICSTR